MFTLSHFIGVSGEAAKGVKCRFINIEQSLTKLSTTLKILYNSVKFTSSSYGYPIIKYSFKFIVFVILLAFTNFSITDLLLIGLFTLYLIFFCYTI